MLDSQSKPFPESVKSLMPAMQVKRLSTLVLLASVVLNAGGQVLFKAARVAQPDASLLSLFAHPQIWLALGLYAISSVSWLWVLSRAQLSYAYPVLALSYPIVVLLSAWLFSESVSVLRWVGVATIVCGVSLLARS